MFYETKIIDSLILISHFLYEHIKIYILGYNHSIDIDLLYWQKKINYILKKGKIFHFKDEAQKVTPTCASGTIFRDPTK